MDLEIENNLIVGAKLELSPNSSDRFDEIELIVLHCISLPEGKYNNNYPTDLFLNKLDFNIHPSFQTLKNLKRNLKTNLMTSIEKSSEIKKSSDIEV